MFYICTIVMPFTVLQCVNKDIIQRKYTYMHNYTFTYIQIHIHIHITEVK